MVKFKQVWSNLASHLKTITRKELARASLDMSNNTGYKVCCFFTVLRDKKKRLTRLKIWFMGVV